MSSKTNRRDFLRGGTVAADELIVTGATASHLFWEMKDGVKEFHLYARIPGENSCRACSWMS